MQQKAWKEKRINSGIWAQQRKKSFLLQCSSAYAQQPVRGSNGSMRWVSLFLLRMEYTFCTAAQQCVLCLQGEDMLVWNGENTCMKPEICINQLLMWLILHPLVITAAPVSQRPIARHSFWSSAVPAARWMAPSTPPPSNKQRHTQYILPKSVVTRKIQPRGIVLNIIGPRNYTYAGSSSSLLPYKGASKICMKTPKIEVLYFQVVVLEIKITTRLNA